MSCILWKSRMDFNESPRKHRGRTLVGISKWIYLSNRADAFRLADRDHGFECRFSRSIGDRARAYQHNMILRSVDWHRQTSADLMDGELWNLLYESGLAYLEVEDRSLIAQNDLLRSGSCAELNSRGETINTYRAPACSRPAVGFRSTWQTSPRFARALPGPRSENPAKPDPHQTREQWNRTEL